MVGEDLFWIGLVGEDLFFLIILENIIEPQYDRMILCGIEIFSDSPRFPCCAWEVN